MTISNGNATWLWRAVVSVAVVGMFGWIAKTTLENNVALALVAQKVEQVLEAHHGIFKRLDRLERPRDGGVQ